MSTAADRANFDRLRGGASAGDLNQVLPQMPALPADVKKRFPSLDTWERQVEEWRKKVVVVLRNGQS